MKLICLTSIYILVALLNFHPLFAQTHTTPLNQTSLEVNQYSSISSYTGNSNVAPQMQMDPTIVEGIEEALGLEAFREALKNHPTAERLVIHREGGTVSIRSRGGAQDIYGANGIHQNENRDIIDQLKKLLPLEFANDPLLKYQLPSNDNRIRIGTDPLSVERLQIILNKIELELIIEEDAKSTTPSCFNSPKGEPSERELVDIPEILDSATTEVSYFFPTSVTTPLLKNFRQVATSNHPTEQSFREKYLIPLWCQIKQQGSAFIDSFRNCFLKKEIAYGEERLIVHTDGTIQSKCDPLVSPFSFGNVLVDVLNRNKNSENKKVNNVLRNELLKIGPHPKQKEVWEMEKWIIDCILPLNQTDPLTKKRFFNIDDHFKHARELNNCFSEILGIGMDENGSKDPDFERKKKVYLILHLIVSRPGPNVGSYKKADDAWQKLEEYKEKRETVEKKVKETAKALDKINEDLKYAEEKFAEANYASNFVAKGAKGLSKIADGGAHFKSDIVGVSAAIVKGAAEVTHAIVTAQTMAHTLREVEQKAALVEQKAAIKLQKIALEQVVSAEKNAEKTEKEALKSEPINTDFVKNFLLDLSKGQKNDEKYTEWLQEKEIPTNFILEVYNYQAKNPAWVREAMAVAWAKRMETSATSVKKLQDEQSREKTKLDEDLAVAEQTYETSKIKFDKLWDFRKKARKRLERHKSFSEKLSHMTSRDQSAFTASYKNAEAMFKKADQITEAAQTKIQEAQKTIADAQKAIAEKEMRALTPEEEVLNRSLTRALEQEQADIVMWPLMQIESRDMKDPLMRYFFAEIINKANEESKKNEAIQERIKELNKQKEDKKCQIEQEEKNVYNYIQKVEEAKNSKKNYLEKRWHEIAILAQKIVDYREKSMMALDEEDKNLATQWDFIANDAKEALKYRIDALQQEIGKNDIIDAFTYIQKTEELEKIIECRKKFIELVMQGNPLAAQQWSKAVVTAEEILKVREEIAQAEKERKMIKVYQCQQKIKTLQCILGYKIKSAEEENKFLVMRYDSFASALEKSIEYHESLARIAGHWNQCVGLVYEIIDDRKKALECNEQGKYKDASFWDQVATMKSQYLFCKEKLTHIKRQDLVDIWTKAAEAAEKAIKLKKLINLSQPVDKTKKDAIPRESVYRNKQLADEQDLLRKCRLHAAEALESGNKESSTSWSKAAEALEIAIDYQKNVHPHFELITENYFEEKEALDNCWISIIQIAEQIIEYRLKDAEAINNDRNKFDKYCSEASIYLNDASSLLNEVTTGNKEKIEEITLFIQVAKQAQRLAHQWIDAAQECERGNLINANEIENKIEKNKSLSRAAKAIEGLKDAAVYLKKATKATAEGEEKKAKDWTEAAKFSSTASRDFLKAIEDYDANRESDGGYVENFGFANLNVAEQLAKEIEANIEGHRDEFEEREELIKQNQLAHEYNTKSKDQKNASWQNAAWGIICATEKYNNAIIAKCTNKSKLYEAWIDIFTLCKQAINSFETAANKIDEGPDLHNIPYDAPRGSYYAALKAATVANEGKIDEGASWNMVGFGYNDAADELTKAIEAEEDGMLKLAEDLRETAKQHKQSSECYTKSLKTYTTEETVENDSWNWNMAGFCYSNAAEATAIAIEIEDDGNTAVSQTLREASIKYQQSAGMYNKAAQYYSEGIDAIAVKFAALSLKNAADSLTKKADYQAKAAEARSVGEEALAIGYEEAAEKSETASSKYEQASQAFTEESENSECVKLLDAAKATQDEADQQSKIAEEKEEKCISRPTSITIRSQIIV